MELNAGRFHLRPLRRDSRVDDVPALLRVGGRKLDEGFITKAAADWEADRAYRWAVAEQTNVELAAVAELLLDGDTATVAVHPAGDPARVLEVDDPAVVEVTVGDACGAARDVVTRFAEQTLGVTVRVLR